MIELNELIILIQSGSLNRFSGSLRIIEIIILMIITPRYLDWLRINCKAIIKFLND